MISALATAYLVLADAKYLELAEKAFDWLWSALFVEDKHELTRRFCDGEAAIPAFLDDYASLAHAALSLFEATGNNRLSEEVIGAGQPDNGGALKTPPAASSAPKPMRPICWCA